MTDILFWHHSEVQRVMPPDTPDGAARVVLSAGAIERFEGPNHIKAGLPGYLKPLELRFEQARVSGNLAECVGGVSSGELRLNSTRTQRAEQINLPWHCHQPLTLTLTFRLGGVLVIEASAASCIPGEGTRFMESFAC